MMPFGLFRSSTFESLCKTAPMLSFFNADLAAIVRYVASSSVAFPRDPRHRPEAESMIRAPTTCGDVIMVSSVFDIPAASIMRRLTDIILGKKKEGSKSLCVLEVRAKMSFGIKRNDNDNAMGSIQSSESRERGREKKERRIVVDFRRVYI